MKTFLLNKIIYAADPFYGDVTPPAAINKFINEGGQAGGGLVVLINNLIKILIVGAGLFMIVNFITAGYQMISSSGDPKKLEQAWTKIWHSLLGIVIIAAAFLLAALAGQLLFNDPTIFLQLRIYTPGP
mgnify:CR=1 FL=1